jgi:hypothetical protein
LARASPPRPHDVGDGGLSARGVAGVSVKGHERGSPRRTPARGARVGEERSGSSAAAPSRSRIGCKSAIRTVARTPSLVGRSLSVKPRPGLPGAIPFPCYGDYLAANPRGVHRSATDKRNGIAGEPATDAVPLFSWLHAARARHLTADFRPRTTRWTIGQCGHSGLRRASNTQE